MPKQNIYQIDAEGKVLGRLASEVALILRGKNLKDWRPNKLPSHKVIVNNISKIKFTGKKLQQKKYFRFTGYPGGIKTYTLEELWQKNPGQLFKNVVFRMLPKNKLRSKIIKNLMVKV